VFPWHALVPFLTNTGPPTVHQTPTATLEHPIEKQHQNIKTTASPKKASQSEHCISTSDARKFKSKELVCTIQIKLKMGQLQIVFRFYFLLQI
jgi:hypothetical protein